MLSGNGVSTAMPLREPLALPDAVNFALPCHESSFLIFFVLHQSFLLPRGMMFKSLVASGLRMVAFLRLGSLERSGALPNRTPTVFLTVALAPLLSLSYPARLPGPQGFLHPTVLILSDPCIRAPV